MVTMNESPAPQEQTTPSLADIQLPLTIRTSFKEYRRRIGVVRVGLALAISLIILARYGFFAWIVFLVLIAALLAAILWVLLRRSLTLTDSEVVYKNAFGKERRSPISDITEVKVFAQYVDYSFGVMPRIIIATRQFTPLASLVGLFWAVEDLQKLAIGLEKVGVKGEVYDQPAASVQIAKQFPHLTPYYERHPYLTATYITIGIVAVIALGVIAGMAWFDL